MSIHESAHKPLTFLAEHHDPHEPSNAGHYWLDGSEIAAATNLPQRAINDAVAILLDAGLVESYSPASSPPYTFDAIAASPHGKLALSTNLFPWSPRVTENSNHPVTIVVNGSGNALSVASPNSVQSVASGGSVIGSIPVLEQALRDSGVSEADIIEIRDIVATEPLGADRRFGPRASAWMGTMISKSAQGLWPVGVSAAGGLLERLLGAFFGIT